MAVLCAPADIAADAGCFTCLSEKLLAGAMVYLLSQLVKQSDPMVDVSPAAIAANSSCYTSCLSGKGLLGAQVYLLCLLTNGSGGTGPGTLGDIRLGHGPPTGPGGTAPLFYVDLDCSTEWTWDPTTLTWTEMDGEKGTGKYSVPTVVELRAIPTLVCNLVEAHTFGNLTIGDEQPSWYRWDPDIIVDPDSGDPDTGMSLIKPDDRAAGDPGRWVQVVFA